MIFHFSEMVIMATFCRKISFDSQKKQTRPSASTSRWRLGHFRPLISARFHHRRKEQTCWNDETVRMCPQHATALGPINVNGRFHQRRPSFFPRPNSWIPPYVLWRQLFYGRPRLNRNSSWMQVARPIASDMARVNVAESRKFRQRKIKVVALLFPVFFPFWPEYFALDGCPGAT